MFLDTSGLLCVLARSESFHKQALEIYEAAVRRVTHDGVLCEFVALAQTRNVRRSDALGFVAEVIADPQIETVWTSRDHHLEALQLLQQRRDKTYSLCDALSFVLMRQRGLAEALTTDRHFEQEGFRRLLV